MDSIVYIIPIMAVIGLVVMAFKSAWVSKQDAGSAAMKELSDHIHSGAMAFLKAEWKVLAYYAVIAALLLGWSGTSNIRWIRRFPSQSPFKSIGPVKVKGLNRFPG